MNEIEQFKQRAKEQGICELESNLNDCRNRKQYIDLLLNINGIEYMFEAMRDGWGVSYEFISETFTPFINGKYIAYNKKYDAELYCKYNGKITARTTILAVIDSEIEINIPLDKYPLIYAVSGSKITLTGEGRGKVYLYGDIELDNRCSGNVKIKQMIDEQ